MRITGGAARGIPISTGRAGHVRPATDRMREAVFSSLGPVVHEAAVLDLFAGSGSYGLEALSRGAASAIFVEKHPQAVAALEANLKAVLKSIGQTDPSAARTIRRDVLRFSSSTPFDLIFMDPPYDLVRSSGDTLLQLAGELLKDGGILVYELPGDIEPALTGWNVRRRIGKSGINDPSVLLLEGSNS